MVSAVFHLRRDTALGWANKNPVLRSGEPGVAIDTGTFKFGDGVRTWLDLPAVAAAEAAAALAAAEAAEDFADDAAVSATAADGFRALAQTARNEAEGFKNAAATSASSAAGAVSAAFLGTTLGTNDLNTMTTPGVYRQITSGDATLARNYPVASQNGVLRVSQVSGSGAVIQTWNPHNGNATQAARLFYQRSLSSGTWSAWRTFGSQRTAQTAGQPAPEMYLYDEVNLAERRVMLTELILGSQDLNNVMTPGRYRQGDSSAATTARNYPIAGTTWQLDVTAPWGAASAVQVLTPHVNSTDWTNRSARAQYIRSYNTNTWTPWRTLSTTRVDQTAGRAIYTWDDLNGREQLVYGDTGSRTITPLFSDVVSGTVTIQRVGWDVTVDFANVQFTDTSATSVHTYTGVLPDGFRPLLSQRLGLAQGINASGLATTYTNGDLQIAKGNTSALFNTLTWKTRQAWPTTLPGTANGAIPNL